MGTWASMSCHEYFMKLIHLHRPKSAWKGRGVAFIKWLRTPILSFRGNWEEVTSPISSVASRPGVPSLVTRDQILMIAHERERSSTVSRDSRSRLGQEAQLSTNFGQTQAGLTILGKEDIWSHFWDWWQAEGVRGTSSTRPGRMEVVRRYVISGPRWREEEERRESRSTRKD